MKPEYTAVPTRLKSEKSKIDNAISALEMLNGDTLCSTMSGEAMSESYFQPIRPPVGIITNNWPTAVVKYSRSPRNGNPVTFKEAVVRVLGASVNSMKARDVRRETKKLGITCKKQTIAKILCRLKNEGKIRKVASGTYTI